ncbi:hypothetical protein PENNAL_c0524G03108, partial [Penicillium nalgiovense]
PTGPTAQPNPTRKWVGLWARSLSPQWAVGFIIRPMSPPWAPNGPQTMQTK